MRSRNFIKIVRFYNIHMNTYIRMTLGYGSYTFKFKVNIFHKFNVFFERICNEISTNNYRWKNLLISNKNMDVIVTIFEC